MLRRLDTRELPRHSKQFQQRWRIIVLVEEFAESSLGGLLQFQVLIFEALHRFAKLSLEASHLLLKGLDVVPSNQPNARLREGKLTDRQKACVRLLTPVTAR